MATRVPVEIHYKEKTVSTVALVNTGFETKEPQVLLPEVMVRDIWPDAFKKKKTDSFMTPAGPGILTNIGSGKIRISCEDIKTEMIQVTFLVSEYENEVILNDISSGELGIQILDIGKGQWRLKFDSDKKLRNSLSGFTWERRK